MTDDLQPLGVVEASVVVLHGYRWFRSTSGKGVDRVATYWLWSPLPEIAHDATLSPLIVETASAWPKVDTREARRRVRGLWTVTVRGEPVPLKYNSDGRFVHYFWPAGRSVDGTSVKARERAMRAGLALLHEDELVAARRCSPG